MDVPELTAANEYDAETAHWIASLQWLVWKVYGKDIPTNLQVSEQVSGALIEALTSSTLYVKACKAILNCSASNHASVLEALSRRGIYVLSCEGSAVTAVSLSDRHLNKDAHQSVLDSLMWAQAQCLASVEKVVWAVRELTSFSASAELPSHTEEALLWWLGKATGGIKLQQLEDLSDGRALALTIANYYPLELRQSDIAQEEDLGIADCLYNLQLVQVWCDSKDLLCPGLDDLFYSHSVLRPYLLVFVAHLFSKLTSKTDGCQPSDINSLMEEKAAPRQAWPPRESLLARVSMDAASPASDSDSEYSTPVGETPVPAQTSRSYTVDRPVFRNLPEAPPQRPGSLQLPKTSFAQIKGGSPSTPPKRPTSKVPKKTTFATPPNQTTWQEIVHKCNSPDVSQQNAPGAVRSDMRMQFAERRRQIERNKRQQEMELSKQRQRVGKAAFMQVISKEREEEPQTSSPQPLVATRYSSSLDKLNASLSELQGQIMRLSLEKDNLKQPVKEEGGSPYWQQSDTARLAEVFKAPPTHSEPCSNASSRQFVPTECDAPVEYSWSAQSRVAFQPIKPIPSNLAPTTTSLNTETETAQDTLTKANEPASTAIDVSNNTEVEESVPGCEDSEQVVGQELPNGFFVDLDDGKPLKNKPEFRARSRPKTKSAPVNGWKPQPGPAFEVPVHVGSSDVDERREKRVQMLANKRQQDLQRVQEKLQNDRERLAQEQREKEERVQQKKEEEKQRRQQIFEEYLRRKAEREAEDNSGGQGPVRLRMITPKRTPQRPRSQILESPGSSSQEDLTVPRSHMVLTAETEQEYRGPRLFKKPSQKSNKQVVSNAVSHCCLAGTVNSMLKKQVLEVIMQSESKHFVILFRDASLQYRGLYNYNPDTQEVTKIQGKGPNRITDIMIEKFYKYNSGAKQFSQVTTTKHMSATIDAVVLYNHCWQKSRRP